MSERPYLSVVATARNDDHGGRLLYRMQLFVDGLIAQCNRYGLDAELVLVEWNPPADRPRLAEALRWPANTGRLTVRIIEVPNDVHSRLRHSERLPLFQMIAKNVGIRRARGEFVLATNIDLLFSNELMEFIAKRTLKPRTLYRVDRYDVDADIDESASVDARLRQCEQTLIRVSRRDGTLDLRDGTFYRIYDSLYYLPWWIGIPIRLVRDGWRPFLRGAVRKPYKLAVRAARVSSLVWGLTRRTGTARRGGGEGRLAHLFGRLRRSKRNPVRIFVVGSMIAMHVLRTFLTLIRLELVTRQGRFRARWRRRWATYSRLFEFERARIKLHTNASGDFELLARDDWDRTHGYAELEMYSMHLDSLHMYMAYWSGIRESFLRYRVYHLEHEGGFKPDPEGSGRLNERLDRDRIRQITNEELLEWIVQMARTRRSLPTTNPDWGFAEVQFPEVQISRPTNLAEAVAHQ